ncbi:rod shape-determining protein MreD [Acidihalobacter yilgarnensis]|uniref:Rod shape-determining protein MreD n=1 Tax=Acidihalobacter yilgarnensis TaxID=2819280 RepID=A0A1D8IKC4_9GAMM|nr:rod shape-determining protein MreD [Acidihalobacter yilgarnensis]AOU96916.1 rod shape-determining protein MreD [Acidihalobacter yilgarnensis]
MTSPLKRNLGIGLTLVIALSLSVIAMPASLTATRPEWVAMAIIYWSMALPRRISLGTAWLTGLLLDVLTGSLLGQHALALTIVAYLSIRTHQRVRVYPLWQQSIAVGLMLLVYRILLLWVYGITGHAPDQRVYWIPVLTSMLLWPLIFLLLRHIRRRLQLTG